jgi:glycosyltransferase involved in cell wall biosynthesis
MLLENSRYPQDPRVRREATALVQAGLTVTVISPGASDQARVETIYGVTVYRFPMPRRASGPLGYVWEYGYSLIATFLISLWVLMRRGFDVIHAHNPPDLFVFIAGVYKLIGKRFVFDHHDLSPELYAARFRRRSPGAIGRVLVWLEKLSCRVADHVIATNDSYRAVQMTRGRVPAEKITVVRNGPDLERLAPVAEDAGLRSRAGTLIGFVGEMGHQDGVDYLLRALKHLREDLDRNDFHCVLMGTGDARPSLMTEADALGLGSHVWFTGYIPDADMIRYLSTIDIGVDPDPSNPFNDRSTMIKMMEYMAMSKPIVAFDLPEHRVTADGAALYAVPNDELDFARQLASLMDDPARRVAMGVTGRHRVETVLAWPLQAPRLLEAYEKLGVDTAGR